MKKKKFIVLISLLILVFLFITYLVVVGKTNSFDNIIYKIIRSLESDFCDKYFIFITKFGNIDVVIGMVICLIFAFRNRHAIMVTTLVINSAITNQLVKHIILRDRPNVLRLIEQGGYSYPSGHTMIAICLYGYLLYLAFTKINNKFIKYICSIILFVLILSISVSRIYVGVHYASDVAGGLVLALIELLLLIDFSKKQFRGN